MIPHLARLFALILSLSISIVATTNESPSADEKPLDRDTTIENLKAQKVNVAAFTMKVDSYVPTIGLGTV